MMHLLEALRERCVLYTPAHPAMGVEDTPCTSYVDDAPENFAKSCNVLLKLDDGSELPAHSQILARFSSVCADMHDDDGPLSCASCSKKVHLPLTDCSRATAVSFLSVVYSTQQFEQIKKSKDNRMEIALLAHKLNMEVYCLSRQCMTTPSELFDEPL